MKKLRYGIIGVNAIAYDKHLPFYAAMKDDVELVAACDIDEGRLGAVAEKYGFPLLFRDYHELLARPDIDLVSICLPNALHAPVAVEAMGAGKHVHCEKPMARNAEEARQMLQVSRETGRKLMVGLNNRFTPWSRYVKDYVQSGELGEIYYAKCAWVRRNGLPPDGWFIRRELSGGGAMIDLGVHYLDLVLHFMGYPPVRTVTARTYTHLATGPNAGLYAQTQVPSYGKAFDVEELGAGFLTLEGGASVSFEINWASNVQQEQSSYELYGTKGGVRFVRIPGKPPELRLFTVIGGKLADVIPDLPTVYLDELEFHEFVSCIRENRDPVTAPPEEAVKIMELLDAIYRSAAEGREIRL